MYMHVSVIEFFIQNVKDKEIKGKRILEVGSKYVNGSIRPFIERLHPREYVGVDIERGKFVDVVLPAEKLIDAFGVEAFDVVISTELMEHVKDWRIVVNNMKKVLRPNGYIYLTTRSYGYPYHGYPFDFWRYEIGDIRKIFSDFKTIALKKDHLEPGVFLKAVKPKNQQPFDVSTIKLYSVILGKRTHSIPDVKDMPTLKKLGLKVIKVLKKQTHLKGILTRIQYE
jgi:SAM-dependent methyltransferase